MRNLIVLFFASISTVINAQTAQRPKLVVGIVVDQMRYDYLYRFDSLYKATGKKGFSVFLEKGFNCRNTQYNYIPTYTGPGHASIYTGSVPALNGIIANDWFDRSSGKWMYVVSDSNVSSVGTSSSDGKMSPANLLTTTITDELKLSNAHKSKVIGISIKDRSAVLPIGHLGNAAYWFDKTTGNFISSSYYMETLPEWVIDFNKKRLADSMLQKWETFLPIEHYNLGLKNGDLYRKNLKGDSLNRFPYDLAELKKKNNYELLAYTPGGNSIITNLAIHALKSEQLGKGPYTDFITISYSATDYVGHQFGINSIETQDIYTRLNMELATLLEYLDKNYGMQNVLVFLTSDHGAAQTVNQMKDLRIPSGIFDPSICKKALTDVLNEKYGAHKWILGMDNMQLWFDLKLADSLKIKRDDLLQSAISALEKMDGVREVYKPSALKNSFNGTDIHAMLSRGIFEKRSGDLGIDLLPGWYDTKFDSKGGTTHGTGYIYDTHVPLLWLGWNIPKGSSADPVYITDIAATLADLLKISRPNGCIGNPIFR